MTAGIIDRFRTMAIFRPPILIARIVASALQTLVSMVAVFGIALAWCGGLGLLGLAWSVSVFSRRDRKT
jgi:hypothetical protein